MAILNHEIKEWLPPDFFSHGKRGRLIDPHQRRMYRYALVQPQRQRHLHRFDSVIAAIGIAGIVCLTHPRNQVACTAPIGKRSGKAEKNKIAARNEGGRQAIVGEFNTRLARESGVGNGGQAIKVHHVILA
jgi:hypothetical protein